MPDGRLHIRSVRLRVAAVACAALTAVTLGACGGSLVPSTPTITPTSTTADDGGGPTGPHSPAGRTPDATEIRTEGDTVVRIADFGDIDLGANAEFRAPVRAYLVTPATKLEHTPLVVIGHLRYPSCPDMVVAYPCPDGATSQRFDAGMVYLGQRLAQAGYSTLIPDLSPLYVGDDVRSPYDQVDGLTRTLTMLLGQLDDAVAGGDTAWGEGLADRIDTDRFGFVAHSRSGTVAGDLVPAMAEAGRTVSSVLIYGGAFDVAYHGEEGTSPAMPDVPLLTIVGDQDADTGFMGTMWLSAHLAEQRSTPALAAVVPGLGHTFVNQTLSAEGIDDRICEQDCPSAAEHEQFLGTVATQWFDTTMRAEPSSFPLDGTAALPDELGGLPARWLATTNGSHQRVFDASVVGTLKAFGPDARATTCFPPEPMAPAHPDDCPLPDLAVIWGAAPVTQISVGAKTGVRLSVDNLRGATGANIHLNPTDDRTDGAVANPLRVDVEFSDGRSASIPFDGNQAALRDRAHNDATGVYAVSTLRVPLPSWAAGVGVRSITLTGNGETTARFDIRAIDITTIAS